MISNLGYGFLISAVVVAVAFWRRSLSASGAVGAMVVGTLIFGLGGWQWGLSLGIFFVTSSLLSHFKEAEKQIVAEKFDKGHQRDIGQVLANGSLGTLVAVLNTAIPSPFWFLLFVGIMATVTADTWATELGTLSRRPPRLITSGRIVEPGTSGGISLLGTTISLAGGLLVGLTAALFNPQSEQLTALPLVLAGTTGGLVGSLIDSVLGATIQQIYYCDVCRKDTERKMHKCGNRTRPLRGWSWINNDLVNLLSSLGGGGIAVLIGFLFT